jgi:sialate O-acetylesterase
MRKYPFILLLVQFTLPLRADVMPNPLFADGMVLQRDKSVPVWGTARDGEKVTVEIADQRLATTATGGKWKVELAAMKAGGPHTMIITGNNVVTIGNILIGDVWLCSGQSNMNFQLKSVEDAGSEIASMNAPSVRFFTVKQQFGQAPLPTTPGQWKDLTPSTAGECSAVAAYFGNALNQKLDVPIGLIVSSVGGTRIESWMRLDVLKATGESKSLINKWKDMPADEFKAIETAYARFQYQRDRVHPNEVRAARESGQPLPPPPVQPKLRCHDCPGALHNGMIAPLEPFPIRGVIWYQGESNAGQAKPYETLLPTLIADWRGVWGVDLPFLFVQLAPHKSIHPSFREAQHRIWQSTPGTAMVVTTDVGNMENIHPTLKRPVGERLALAARFLAYGERIVSSGPVFERMRIDANRAIISFTHVGGGLVAREGDLKGFTMAGNDGNFLPATARVEGDAVVVSCGRISRPTAVRYNWGLNPDGNLCNREGLPAAPFRTDQRDSVEPPDSTGR